MYIESQHKRCACEDENRLGFLGNVLKGEELELANSRVQQNLGEDDYVF